MPALVPALPVTPVPATPPVAAETAPTADSSGDFQATLSSALGEGHESLAQEDRPSGTDNPSADDTASADSLAAAGNALPPALPPEAVVAPEQIVAVVLQALNAQTAAAPTAGGTLEMGDTPGGTGLNPVSGKQSAVVANDMLTTRLAGGPVATPAPTPEASPSLPDSVRLSLHTPPASHEAPLTPAVFVPDQSALAAKPDTGIEPFKQAVMENLSRLGAAVDDPGSTSVATTTLAAFTPSAPQAAPAPTGTSLPVPVPFGQATWGQALGQQVVWAVSQQLSSAELHLSPPELGPVSVRISMDADQGTTNISFAAAHGAVREAIEAALPRLRDMLSTQGIALTDVNVSSQESFRHAQQESAAGRSAGWQDNSGGDEPATEARVVVRSLRLLDTYA